MDEDGDEFWNTLLKPPGKIVWNTLLNKYKGHDFPGGWSDLMLRRHLKFKCLVNEITEYIEAWEEMTHDREIPDMQQLIAREYGVLINSFVERFRKKLQKSGYHVDENEVMIRLHPIYIPASTSCRCYHCGNIVDVPMGQMLCPLCCGWWLLEMDPTNQENLPPTMFDRCQHALHLRVTHEDDQVLASGLRGDALIPIIIDDAHIEKGQLCFCDEGNFQVGQKATRLITCGHVFHNNCITKWLSTHTIRFQKRCPYCRSVMPTTDPLYNIGLRVAAIEAGNPPLPPEPYIP